MKKSACIAVILLIFSFGVFADSFGAGIFYSKTRFRFKQYDRPPFSAIKRLSAGEKFPQELQFYIDFAGNSFKYDFDMHLFTKKAYKTLLIKEISYSFEGKTCCFLKNAEFILPTNIYNVDEEEHFPYWITDSVHYWSRGVFAEPVKKTKRLPRVNFERIFKGKEPGSTFSFNMSVVYQFDCEEEKTLAFEYRVECYEGEWVSPFMGW